MKKRTRSPKKEKQVVGTKELPTEFSIVELIDKYQILLNEQPLQGCSFRKKPDSLAAAEEALELLIKMSKDSEFFTKCLNDPDRYIQLLAEKLKGF